MSIDVNARPVVYRGMAVWIVLCGAAWNAGFAQNAPAPTEPDPNSPLAPVQQRDQAVSQYDPLAQDKAAAEAKAKAQREIDQRRQQDRKPIPGSIADSETVVPRRAPRVQPDDSDAERPVRDYAGPVVLTRDYSLGQMELPKEMKWSESVGVATSYDTGLGQIGPNGPQSAGDLTGTTFSWSFGGGHVFQHDSISFSTGGSASYYPGSGFYTGNNSSLTASWMHIINRRFSTSTAIAGGMTSANAALTGYSAGPGTIANVNLATSPDIGVFDNGSKQASVSSALNWKISGRMSATFNGAWFGVTRNSPLLTGVTGSSAGGDLSYRLTRKMTVGSTYSFSQYVYPQHTQLSNAQSAGAIFSYAFNRSTQIRFNGGLSRIETQGLQVVEIDPIIALILGRTSGIIDAYQAFNTTNISAQLVRDFRRRGTVSLAYARGVTPGNGLFQTSMVESASVTFGTTLRRTYSLSFSAIRSRTGALTQAVGDYTAESALMSLSRGIGHGASVNLSVQYRHFEISTLTSLRNQLTISSGVSWGNRNGRLLPF